MRMRATVEAQLRPDDALTRIWWMEKRVDIVVSIFSGEGLCLAYNTVTLVMFFVELLLFLYYTREK